jgi:hypothetical protein
MDRINKQLVTDALDEQYNPAVSAAVMMGKKLLNRYSGLIDQSNIYRIAMGMYPVIYSFII